MKILSKFSLVLVFFSLISCSHNKVAVSKLSDAKMSCEEILREMTELIRKTYTLDTPKLSSEQFKELVRKMYTSDAPELSDERLRVLDSMYKERCCILTKLQDVINE